MSITATMRSVSSQLQSWMPRTSNHSLKNHPGQADAIGNRGVNAR